MKRLLIVFCLVAIVALPFVLRPKQRVAAEAQDVVVIVTPHNEAIRHEFALGFQEWYRAQTGRTVTIDWRVLGGTSEIARYLEGEYVAAFRNYWVNRLGRPWSTDVQAGFQSPHLPPAAPAAAREARAEFLHSGVSCGIDLFFGGGSYDFDQQADAGRFWASGTPQRHPDWFTDATIPQDYAGEEFREPHGLWLGAVISAYGIIYNRDALARLGIGAPPAQWDDLADPRYFGEVALCDPTKSGSIAMAFENLIQQKMQQRLQALGATPALSVAAREAEAVAQGWAAGLQSIQRIGANARYFTDTSQKPPIDVADGNCAAGMCIDFYGTQQAEAVVRRGDSHRLGFASPAGGTAYSVDPIGLLRGAPHRPVAEAFIDYVLSLAGQKLWDFKPGVPGGPKDFALRRLPVRRDFYSHSEWNELRSDPELNPYGSGPRLVYRSDWTGSRFRQMAFIIRVMCQDTHSELVQAWAAILRAPPANRPRALALLQDVSFVSYARAGREIKQALNSRDKVNEIRLARELADRFRVQYRLAQEAAEGK